MTRSTNGQRHMEIATSAAIDMLKQNGLEARAVRSGKHVRVQSQLPGQGWIHVTSIRSTTRGGDQATEHFAVKNVNQFLRRHGYR